MKYTYAKYPWYAANSENQDLIVSPVTIPLAKPAIYTVGYEGRDIDRFIDHLLSSGLRGVCDVRAVPASRSFGFHRKTLAEFLAKLEMSYYPFPGLGIPTGIRKETLLAASVGLMFSDYRDRITHSHQAELRELLSVLASQPVALLCVEHNAQDCHRGVLAEVLAQMTEMQVVHL
jgi:uncharacterized protein (DUF488 family)